MDRFRAILDHVRPQVILSTHGSLNHGFFDLAREHLGVENVRCVTYCGELFGRYGFSRHWVNPQADLFIGAVPETCAMARSLGMPAERTLVGGFLLNPSFYRKTLSAEERATLLRGIGLDPERGSRCCCPPASTGRTTISRCWKRSTPGSRARICRSSRCADEIRGRWKR